MRRVVWFHKLPAAAVMLVKLVAATPERTKKAYPASVLCTLALGAVSVSAVCAVLIAASSRCFQRTLELKAPLAIECSP